MRLEDIGELFGDSIEPVDSKSYDNKEEILDDEKAATPLRVERVGGQK